MSRACYRRTLPFCLVIAATCTIAVGLPRTRAVPLANAAGDAGRPSPSRPAAEIPSVLQRSDDGSINSRGIGQPVPAPGTMEAPYAQPGTVETPRGSLGAGATRGVQLFSGELVESVVDLRIRGRGLDFVMARTYRSRSERSSALGYNWDFSYNIRIAQLGGNRVIYDGNGRADEYQFNGTGWEHLEYARELTQNFDGSYTLTFRDLGRWNFRPIDGSPTSGRIVTIQDRNGNTLTCNYDGLGRLSTVIDTLSRPIQFQYDASNRLTQVTDFTGRAVRYAYYPPGNPNGSIDDLRTVTSPNVTGTPNGNDFPTGKTVTYTYSVGQVQPELNHNLLTIRDPKGVVILTNTYDPTTNPSDLNFDHCKRQLWGAGGVPPIDIVYVQQVPDFSNNFATIKAIVNSRSGHVKEYYYDAQNRGVIEDEFTGQADPLLPTDDFTNRPGPPLRPFDPPVFRTRYEYDGASRLIRVVDPNQNEEQFSYNSGSPFPRARFNLLFHAWLPGPLGGDQPSISESFTYNNFPSDHNFPITHVDGRGLVTQYIYDPLGNRIQTQHRIPTIVEDWTYNSFGQVILHILPPNDTGHRRRDTSAYYAAGPQRGYLQSTTVDATGFAITTSYEYDSLGRKVREIDAAGNDSLTQYNALDQIMREQSRQCLPTTPRVERLNWYDANNNLVRTDVQNYNEVGVLQANTHFSVIYEYDALNNRTRQCEEVGSANLANTVVNCSSLPPGQFVISETSYDADGGLTLTRSGVAVDGTQPTNVVRTLYDERGLAYRIISAEGDPNQSITQFDYDGNRNVIRQTVGADTGSPRVTVNNFDGYNRLRTMTDPMGNVTVHQYDPNHNLVYIRTDGEIEDQPGSALNVRLSEAFATLDAMDRVIQYRMAFFDIFTQVPIGPGMSTTTTAYSPVGQVMSVMDANGYTTSTSYDTANRVSVVTDPKGNTTQYQHNALGNVIAIVETEISDLGTPPQSYTSTFQFDCLGRQTQTNTAAGVTTQGYDSRGNVVVQVDALGHESRTSYDGVGHTLQTVRDMNGNGANGDAPDIVQNQTYDANGRLLTQSDDNGNVTTYAYDSMNHQVRTTHADGTLHQATHDVYGNEVQRVDANGTVAISSYDLLDRLVARNVVPGPGVSPDTTFEAYRWDGKSRLVYAQDNDSIVTQRTDSLSRVTLETLNGVATQSVWDAGGNKTSITYPGGRTISIANDGLSRPTAVSDDLGVLAAYSYFGARRVERRTYRNGTTFDYQYGGAREITRTTHTSSFGPPVVDDRTYIWDGTGNKLQRKDVRIGGPGLTHNYQYDFFGQLRRTTVIDPALVLVRDTTFALDGAGNRTSVAGMPDAGAYTRDPTTPEPADRQLNQYTRTPFDQRVYDRNGNLTQILPGGCNNGDVDGDGMLTGADVQLMVAGLLMPGDPCTDINSDTITNGLDIQPFINIYFTGLPPATPVDVQYDYRNRMVSYFNPVTGILQTYAYDALGRRIRRSGNLAPLPPDVYYFYDGWQVVEERDNPGGTTLATYVHGLYVDEVLNMRRFGQDYFFHADDMHNVMAVTDAGGQVVERYEYGDFGLPSYFTAGGAPLASSLIANSRLFHGREYDRETGWYHFRTRYLDPRAGRFTTRDGIGAFGDEFGNSYTFVGNNPWSRLDPTGRAWHYVYWWWAWYRYQWWSWWAPWGWSGHYVYWWWWWYPYRTWLWWWWPYQWSGYAYWWWGYYGWWGWYPYRWSWWSFRWWWWWYPYRWWNYWQGWYWWWWPYHCWVWYPYGSNWWYWWYPRWCYYGWWSWWWWCPYYVYGGWWWWWYPYYWWPYYYGWWWGWYWPYYRVWCWWWPYGWYGWYWGYNWWWWYPHGWGWWGWWWPIGWWGPWYGWYYWWYPYWWYGWWTWYWPWWWWNGYYWWWWAPFGWWGSWWYYPFGWWWGWGWWGWWWRWWFW